VLSSVHAFASDPKRGVFILIFLAVVVGASLTLFAWRAPKVSLGGAFALVSRETLLLINNLLLLCAAGAVLLGTLYPLVIDALNLGKLSVGPPYFNAVFAPLMVPVLFLMAAGPVARWKQASLADIVRPLRAAFALAVLVGVGAPFAAGEWSAGVALGLGLAMWIVGASVLQILARAKSGMPPPAFWGMHLAHVGIAVTVVGIVMVKHYETERDVRMAPGDTVAAGGYTIRFLGVEGVTGPNYNAARGNLELLKDGRVLMPLHPEKRKYLSSAMPMTEAFIDPGLTRDIYVSLGDPLEGGDGAWSVRVYYKPFVSWIWAGAVLMALGGLFAASDRRYRLKSATRAATQLAPGAAS
jgi:cytochrome c-type biogenesis protein CcmF